jgi:nucleotide-binding universal stress UspA family protein
MKTILFPTDFSDNSLHASEYAAMLARRLGANIVLLHTYMIPMATEFQVPYDVADFDEISRKSAEERLQEFTTSLIESTGLAPDRISRMVEFGNISDKIVEVAKHISVNMIVMGTKGAETILDRWIGTNAQEVMKVAECPVWIIPENSPIEYPQKVMYAADFEEDEVAATQKVLDIIEPLEVSCKVIHVNEYIDLNSHQKIKETVNNLKSEFEYDDVFVRNIDRSDVIKGLESYIETFKPDVLAMAIHEKSFLNKIFEPSITKHFVQGAKLPMLTFKK